MKVLCLLFATLGWCLGDCGSCGMKCDGIEPVLPCGYDRNKELMKGCSISKQDVIRVKAIVIRPYHQVFENSLCAEVQPAVNKLRRVYQVRFYDWTSSKLEHEEWGFTTPDLSDFMAFEKPRTAIVDVSTDGQFYLGKCLNYTNRYYGPVDLFLPPMAIVNNGIIRSKGYYNGKMMVHPQNWNQTECGMPNFKFQAHSSDRPGFVCSGFKSITDEPESPESPNGSVDRVQQWLSLNITARAKTFTITQLIPSVECFEGRFLVMGSNKRRVTLFNDAAKRVKKGGSKIVDRVLEQSG